MEWMRFFIGGIGFLYGMSLLSNGLQKAVAPAGKYCLQGWLQTPWRGLLAGVGLTAFMQSSSAVVVMLIGMVEARILAFPQTIGIIFGADIGTTITAWILLFTSFTGKSPRFFPTTSLLLCGLLLLGSYFRIFTTGRKRQFGRAMLGLGFLFWGIDEMGTAVQIMGAKQFFAALTDTPPGIFSGMALGVLFTSLMQSSSAAIGILQAFALSGRFSQTLAAALIIGINLGTCMTAVLAGIRVHAEARRVVAAHIFIKLAGVMWGMTVLYFFPPATSAMVNPLYIALVHTSFNVLNVLLLFPWTQAIVSVIEQGWAYKKQGR